MTPGSASTAARAVGRRLRAALPDPIADRGRMLVARQIERRLRRSSDVLGAGLVFHAVAPQAGDRSRELDPAVSEGQLDRTVRYLKRHYRVVRAAELPHASRSRRPGEPLPIAITFDDDLPSHLERAMPVLARNDAVATAFLGGEAHAPWWRLLQLAVDDRAIGAGALLHVPPALTERALSREPWAIGRLGKAIEELPPAERDEVAGILRQAVDEEPPVLGPDGASALAEAGWEIGFHTPRHYLLSTLDDDALAAALRPPAAPAAVAVSRSLAYPHGKAGSREANAAEHAGWAVAYTGYPLALDERTADHLIGRLQPQTSTLGRFALHLARSLSIPVNQ